MQTDSQQCNTQKVGAMTNQWELPPPLEMVKPLFSPCLRSSPRLTPATLSTDLAASTTTVASLWPTFCRWRGLVFLGASFFSKCRDWSWNWGNLVGSWMEELYKSNEWSTSLEEKFVNIIKGKFVLHQKDRWETKQNWTKESCPHISQHLPNGPSTVISNFVWRSHDLKQFMHFS